MDGNQGCFQGKSVPVEETVSNLYDRLFCPVEESMAEIVLPSKCTMVLDNYLEDYSRCLMILVAD